MITLIFLALTVAAALGLTARAIEAHERRAIQTMSDDDLAAEVSLADGFAESESIFRDEYQRRRNGR